jgi:hypothetical protein
MVNMLWQDYQAPLPSGGLDSFRLKESSDIGQIIFYIADIIFGGLPEVLNLFR